MNKYRCKCPLKAFTEAQSGAVNLVLIGTGHFENI